MGSGNRDELAAAGHLTKCVCAPHNRYAAVARALELGMILRHCRRHDESARTHYMGWIVRTDRDPQPSQIVHARRICIAAGDNHTAAHEQFGKRAHAGTGNADEMNGSRVGGIQEWHGGGGI
jgi:hypothetical protein